MPYYTGGQVKRETFWALKDINIEIEKGSTLGIIGRNGSGKSTLLKIITGIYKPTTGKVEVRGRIASLIELGAGFHPEFSGRENILINGTVLGLSKKEIQDRMEDIIKFAELEEFIDAPLRTYSSGMYVRLGFSVAVHVDPDILLIDEVLSVGDRSFNQKCQEKLYEFRNAKKTMILVSHDLDSIERYCDHVVLLEKGKIVDSGSPKRVIDTYRQMVANLKGDALRREQAKDTELGTADDQIKSRWGNGAFEITSLTLFNKKGEIQYSFNSGDYMLVQFEYIKKEKVDSIVFGIAIAKENGVLCYGTNTQIEGLRLNPDDIPSKGKIGFHIENLDLTEGTYYISVAAHAKDGQAYDYQQNFYKFIVTCPTNEDGIFIPHHKWDLSDIGIKE